MVGRRRKIWRRGTTTVETAIVFPLLVLVTVGAIHYGWLFLKAQQITNAARVAVRMAVLPDTTTSEVDAVVASLFSPGKANIAGYTISYYRTPVDSDGEPITDEAGNLVLEATSLAELSGIPITVRITVPRASVDIVNASLFPTPANLTASLTMAKEGT